MAWTTKTTPKIIERKEGEIVSALCGAVKIYEGDFVFINTAGYAVRGTQHTTPMAGFRFWGVAAETVDNSGGSAGDKSILVYQSGIFRVACVSDVAQADVGLLAMLDTEDTGNEQTVTGDIPLGTKDLDIAPVGHLVELLDGNYANVKIDGAIGYVVTFTAS